MEGADDSDEGAEIVANSKPTDRSITCEKDCLDTALQTMPKKIVKFKDFKKIMLKLDRCKVKLQQQFLSAQQ